MKPRFRTRRELSLSSTYRVPRARELRNHVRNSRATRARYLMSIDSLEAAWTTQRRGKRFRSTGRFAECARVTSRGRGRGGEAGIQMTATKRAVTFAGAGCHTHTHTHTQRERPATGCRRAYFILGRRDWRCGGVALPALPALRL